MSNKKYRWHSSEGSCEKCQALNNKEYNSESEIPDKPHPHCKCYVEVIEEEMCDCIENALEEIDEQIGNATVLKGEVQKEIAYFTGVLVTYNFNPSTVSLIESCIDALDQIIGTINDFIRNYNDMKEADTIGGDKYFHAKANCEGAQRGKIGKLVATVISEVREFTDAFRNVLEKKMTIEESIKDIKEDQEANRHGRKQGEMHPDENSGVLVDIYRPNGLPDRY